MPLYNGKQQALLNSFGKIEFLIDRLNICTRGSTNRLIFCLITLAGTSDRLFLRLAFIFEACGQIVAASIISSLIRDGLRGASSISVREPKTDVRLFVVSFPIVLKN